MNTNLDRSIRLRAALCHLAGLIWIPLTPLVIFHTFGALASLTQNQWYFQILLLVSTLIITFSGLPATYLVWYSQRRYHPFIYTQGKRAWQWQRTFSILFLGLLSLTTVLVIPACAETAHNYTSPKEQYIFSWVVYWILMESIGYLLLLFPLIVFLAIQTYRGQGYQE